MLEKAAQALRSFGRNLLRRELPMVSLLLPLFASCNRPPPPVPPPPVIPSGQTLRVATFADYFGSRTLPSFEAKTGNHIELEVFQSNESLLANLDSRRFDVVFLSGYAVEHLITTGRVAKMPRERVPNLAQVPLDFRNPPYDPSLLHCVPYVWWVIGYAYLPPRTGHVIEPSSLDILFAESGPEVAWLDDMRATLGMALRRLGKSANTRDPADIAAAKELLLRALPRGIELIDDPADLDKRGKLSVSMGWSNDVFSLVRKVPQVRFLLPKEGTLLYVDFACVLQSARQPDVGFAFLDHLLEPAISADIANTRLLPTVSEGGRKMLDTEARWLWGTLESLRSHSGSYEPLRDVGDATALYEQAWQEVKNGIEKEKARRAALPPPVPEKKPKPVPIKGKKWVNPLGL
ncbi:MAG TPA: spermidine/putrescine ABC transporter substrate-binding protein [Pseudomonadota bacterium]|nr:spermidine/putrescine ABC transporter substrate-binding protein [Pseudomonadota bacterium]HNN51248.1 spermidine/putrescine ABC transporter substrate-binding protein [Pseudomonadota bacterium]